MNDFYNNSSINTEKDDKENNIGIPKVVINLNNNNNDALVYITLYQVVSDTEIKEKEKEHKIKKIYQN